MSIGVFKPKRGKKATAESQNIVLQNGEIFFETPSGGAGKGAGKIKMGDGITAYSNLPYFLQDTNTTYGVATQQSNGLMSTTDKTKLDGIATGANKTVVDSALSSTSSNPVRNSAVYSALSGKSNTNHTHSYLPLSGGTLNANTNYTTNQVRNTVFVTTDPGANASTSYANGSIIAVYE